jgi:hypothetical protein
MEAASGNAHTNKIPNATDGHIYKDVDSIDEAKQVVGNIGRNVHPGVNQYTRVQARNQSTQIVGNMSDEAFAAFMGRDA